MKKLWFSLSAIAASLVVLMAQTNGFTPAELLNIPPNGSEAKTNAPAVSAPTTPARAPTEITFDSGQFNLKSNIFVYTGSVHVNDPQMQLWCEQLTVETPKPANENEQFKRVTAVTNVVIDFLDDDGNTNHATADHAVYTFKVQGSVTNKNVVLTGNPIITNTQGSQSGDEITYNLIDRTISARNGRTIIRQNGTNGPTLFEPLNPSKPKSDGATQ